MKTLITILILFAVGCVKSPEEKIVGGYGRDIEVLEKITPNAIGINYVGMCFFPDGPCEKYFQQTVGGEGSIPLPTPSGEEAWIANWEIKNGEVIVTEHGRIQRLGKETYVFRIEKDESLTEIADGWTKDGKFEREDYAMKDFKTWKKD